MLSTFTIHKSTISNFTCNTVKLWLLICPWPAYKKFHLPALLQINLCCYFILSLSQSLVFPNRRPYPPIAVWAFHSVLLTCCTPSLKLAALLRSMRILGAVLHHVLGWWVGCLDEPLYSLMPWDANNCTLKQYILYASCLADPLPEHHSSPLQPMSPPQSRLSQESATSTCLGTTLIPVLGGRLMRKKQSFPKHPAGISCPVSLSGVSSSVVPYTLCPKEMFCLYAALL